MSEEVVTFVFFTYFSQNFLECGRTTKIAELINEAVVARATRGRSKTTLTFPFEIFYALLDFILAFRMCTVVALVTQPMLQC